MDHRELPPEFITAAEELVAPHARRLRSRQLGNRLRESLLFLPMLLLLGAIGAELLAAEADRRLVTTGTAPGAGLAWLALPPDAAVTLLSTVAGATITTAGVVFSLLVVTLQLASGQFSPRVLRTFWRDRYGQVLIGLLLATFAFCVLALTQIDTSAPHAPVLTVLLALLLAFASILAIVIYLNRITRQQYVGRIMMGIAEETLALIGARSGATEATTPPDLTRFGVPLVVHAVDDGWVQQVSYAAMVEASPPASVVRVETRPGAYLVAGEPVATIWSPVGLQLTDEQAGRITALVRHAIIQGHARTMQQDIDFGLRQLNDIALRALSPAVNDPTTAIEAVMRLASILRRLVRIELPAQVVAMSGDRILLTPWELDHGEYVSHAFAQLRHYGAAHPQVAMALIRTLRMLRAAATQPIAIRALDHETALTVTAFERAGLLPAEIDALRHAAAR